MRRILLSSLLVTLSSASFCGDSSIPFSLEVLPDGQLVLGCARPTCFGWAPTGQPASSTAFFYRVKDNDDGYMRSERTSIPAYGSNDERYNRPQTAVCEQSFSSSECSGVHQWVGGIAPLENLTTYPIMLRCCGFQQLQLSEDRGLAAMTPGQIVVGGEVISSGLQVGFDYIADIAKGVREDGSLQYDVSIRRMPCAGLPEDSDPAKKYGAAARNAATHRALQAPTANVNSPIPLPQQGNAILEEIIQEEAIQLPPGTQFQQQQQIPQQPPQQFLQPPVQQAVAPQYYQPPVQYYSAGGGGGQWCFTEDMTVDMLGGGKKRMDELQKQDWVLAVDKEQLVYVPVEFWLHRVPAQEAEFNEFETEDGKTIKLTDKHYIFKGDCSRVGAGPVTISSLSQEAVTADQVHAGDCLYALGDKDREMHEVRVVRTGRVTQEGIYAPMTSSGRIIVNGVHASCHNIMQEHTTGHALFQYVDMMNRFYDAIFGSDPDAIVETPAGLSTIIAMADLVMPKNILAM